MAARRLRAAISDTRSTTVNQNRCRAKTVEEVKQRDTFAQEKMYFNADSERTKTGAGGIAGKEIEKFNIPRPPVEKSKWKIKIRHLKRWFQKNPLEQEKSQIIPSQGEDKDKSSEEKITKSPREKGKQRKLFKYLRLRRKASSSEEVTIPPAVEKNDKKWHKFLNFFKRIKSKRPQVQDQNGMVPKSTYYYSPDGVETYYSTVETTSNLSTPEDGYSHSREVAYNLFGKSTRLMKINYVKPSTPLFIEGQRMNLMEAYNLDETSSTSSMDDTVSRSSSLLDNQEEQGDLQDNESIFSSVLSFNESLDGTLDGTEIMQEANSGTGSRNAGRLNLRSRRNKKVTFAEETRTCEGRVEILSCNDQTKNVNQKNVPVLSRVAMENFLDNLEKKTRGRNTLPPIKAPVFMEIPLSKPTPLAPKPKLSSELSKRVLIPQDVRQFMADENRKHFLENRIRPVSRHHQHIFENKLLQEQNELDFRRNAAKQYQRKHQNIIVVKKHKEMARLKTSRKRLEHAEDVRRRRAMTPLPDHVNTKELPPTPMPEPIASQAPKVKPTFVRTTSSESEAVIKPKFVPTPPKEPLKKIPRADGKTANRFLRRFRGTKNVAQADGKQANGETNGTAQTVSRASVPAARH